MDICGFEPTSIYKLMFTQFAKLLKDLFASMLLFLFEIDIDVVGCKDFEHATLQYDYVTAWGQRHRSTSNSGGSAERNDFTQEHKKSCQLHVDLHGYTWRRLSC